MEEMGMAAEIQLHCVCLFVWKMPIIVASCLMSSIRMSKHFDRCDWNRWQSNYPQVNMSMRLIWQFKIANISIHWVELNDDFIPFHFDIKVKRNHIRGRKYIYIYVCKCSIIHSFSRNRPTTHSIECTNLHKLLIKLLEIWSKDMKYLFEKIKIFQA